jgi:hypothetical protein
MTLLALLSLVFSAWMAWTLYSSLREEKPHGWRDYLSTIWIGTGTAAGVLTAIFVVLP